jgi:predicted RNA-binding Zn-ribbon protein involved in translation (DUF1610 family)
MSLHTEPDKQRMSCPKCGSADVRRSQNEGFYAYFHSLFGRQPFRCRSCRTKFYKYAPVQQEEETP